MNIFYEMASRLGFYKDVKNCLLKGFTPCAVTGVSNIHKAQTAMALSRLSPCLVICDDEASAIRMTGDINEMAGEQLACVFPAKDLNFAYMEGVSREYEHKRLEALSLITQGKCKIIAASMEACLQGTIPQDNLKEFSFAYKQAPCRRLYKNRSGGGSGAVFCERLYRRYFPCAGVTSCENRALGRRG